jgi:hypothetical protein
MKAWKKCCLGLVMSGGLAPVAWAQLPGVGAPPGAAPLGAGPVAGAPAAPAPAAGPTNILSLICATPDQIAALKAKFCACPLGQMLNNTMRPLNALSGGMLPPCCDNFINPADLLKPTDTAEGAAAAIKAQEADAKARRAAVRYLGTVDCHYFPSARDALIGALRQDTNECVRWEAAMALGSGCCCNAETMKALAITVSGTDEDGNPFETSERVRAAAAGSLQHCLACVGAHTVPLMPEPETAPMPRRGETVPPPIPSGETAPPRPGVLPPPRPAGTTPPGGAAQAAPTAPATPGAAPASTNPSLAYYHALRRVPASRVAAEARLALVKSGYANQPGTQGLAAGTGGSTAPRSSGHSLSEIIASAFNPPPKPGDDGAQPSASELVLQPTPPPPMLPENAPVKVASYQPVPEPTAPEKSAFAPRMSEPAAPVRPVSYQPMSAPAPQPVVSPVPVGFQAAPPPVPEFSVPTKPAAYQPVPASSPVRQVSYQGPPQPGVAGFMASSPGYSNPYGRTAAFPPADGNLLARRETLVPSTGPSRLVHAPANDADIRRLMGVVQNDISPAQREWAAASLGKLSWRTHPEVVDVLLSVATRDTSATVRVECVHSLAEMDANMMAVMNALQILQSDRDPRVQREVSQALARLSGDQGSGMTARP